jgi:hypothetical protein
VDLILLWRNHMANGLSFVYWLLFRQALVFLALWFTVSASQGLIRGRRTREPTSRQRRATRRKLAPIVAAATPSRGNRGQ